MMTFTLETFSNREDWNTVLRCFAEHDFVHTFDFHHVSQQNGEGLPIIFAVKGATGSYVACWPALKRKIPGTDLFDLTSVYGYAGPLFTDREQSEKCLNLIFDGMREIGVVALFSRMHPLFVGQIEKEELRGERLGDVVVIDVQQQTPLVSYRAGHRYEIRKALASGLKIRADHKCDQMGDFVRIYQQTMRDLDASDYYLFNSYYFEKLKNATEFKTFLIFAELDSKKIAASMFVVTGRLMQYYLSGTFAEHRKLSPSKAIIAAAHEIAQSMGIEKIILGGGVGSKEDQLFKFKNGFSDLKMPFHVFKKIIDNRFYLELCDAQGLDPVVTAYFPAYRLPDRP